MELIILLLLFVVSIPIAAWIIIARMRRKISANYTPPVFQSNQPHQFVPPEIAEDFDESFKRCPTCKSTFTDLSLVFCLSDGTPLDLIVKQRQITKPPVTQILENPFASVPTVYAKKDGDELPPTVQSPYPDDKNKT